MNNVVIAGYARTPFAFASKGELARVRPDELAGQGARGGDAELAGVGSGAGHGVAQTAGSGGRQAECRESVPEGRQPIDGHEAHHQRLVYADPHGVAAVAAGQPGESAQLRRSEITSRNADLHRRIAVLGLAPGTVKIHISRILRAFKVQNRTQAVIAASEALGEGKTEAG